jgi:SAM-dependent methyltransferase
MRPHETPIEINKPGSNTLANANMPNTHQQRLSLETLIEQEDLGFEVLHPGGLEITRELAVLCKIQPDRTVLEVAAGTGESACYLQESLGCQVTAIDASDRMVEKARKKAAARHLQVTFQPADAHHLPFEDNSFDAVIAECAMCLFEKEKALREMIRVAKPGGYIGIHDLCWQESTPERMKQRLAEIEGERPETLDGWKRLFQTVGLEEVQTRDKAYLLLSWTKSLKKGLGITGWISLFFKVIKNGGFKGLQSVLESARIFQSEHTGYGLIVGRKSVVNVL